MCVATFMIQLDVTIVNVALPRLQRSLHMSSGGLEWVISAYALSLAALIPVGGVLGDRHGRKRVFLAGLAVFGVGSMACALSSTSSDLVMSRALQGVGGAAMLALTLSIITETFPPKVRAGAIGTWAAIGGIGFGVGPIVGGVLLTFFGWSSVFWVNVPFAAVASVLAVVAVRESRDVRSGRLDVIGVVLIAVGLVGVTLGLIDSASHPWASWPVAYPMVFGVAVLAGFGWWERRALRPIVPPALLRARSFVSASAVYLITYTAFSGVLFYVTLLYQDIEGWSVLRTGLSWLFMNLPFLAVAQLTGRLDRRFPPVVVVSAGCAVAGIGIGALSLAGPSTPFAVTALGYLVAGAGFGALVPGVTNIAMHDVPKGTSGAASGVLNAARQVGTSVGLAVLGAIGAGAAASAWSSKLGGLPSAQRAKAAAQSHNVGGARLDAVTRSLGPAFRHPAASSFVHGYHVAVAVGAGCLLVACIVAARGLPRGSDQTEQRSDTDTEVRLTHSGARAGAHAQAAVHLPTVGNARR